MKKTTIISIILFTLFFYRNAFPQKLDPHKIDTSNYYDYDIFTSGNKKYLKGKKLMSHFIRHAEAIAIISETLEKSGNDCMPNVLYKLENGQYITLDAYDFKHDIGYLYVEIFKGGGKEMRAIKSPYLESHNADYVQCIWTKKGEMLECTVIKNLPANIHLLWAEWYWFQFTENNEDDDYLIDKDIAKKILQQDVLKFIK